MTDYRPLNILVMSMLFLIAIGFTACEEESEFDPKELQTEAYAEALKLNYYEEEPADTVSIQPYTKNSRYWQYKGEPILLLGATDEDNLFNHPDIWPFGLESHLDLMVKNGGNYVRNTMSSRDFGDPWPFGKNGSGVYDLNLWNEEYWSRFENFLRMAYERDIIVQIEIWDRFDYAREPWDLNPFNPKNNVNYTSENSGLPEQINVHPGARRNPFFRTPPELENNKLVLEYQQAFMDKMLSLSLAYPNILYCISNETNESPAWSDYWALYILKSAKEKEKLVYVTEMSDGWDITAPRHDKTYTRPELYAFVDVSQNNHINGQEHWDNAQTVRNEKISEPPRPMNSVKIYSGTRYGGGFEEGTRKIWRNIFGGFATSRFHRTGKPYIPYGVGLSDMAQVQTRSLRMFANEMNVFVCEPANHLLSEREDDEAYAFVETGKQYAVYFPKGGSVSIDLSAVDQGLTMKWLDILNSTWSEEEKIKGGDLLEVTAPDENPYALLILKTSIES